jgi:CIC family chloride channel protein
VLSNPWPAATLSAILICKVAATAATTGSGAVGGVFTPTLFTGAMLGCLCGHGVAAVWPALGANPQAYALVGMGGFLTATTRAPLMAMAMTFGMTLDTGIGLPLISVCVIAYYTARSLHGDSIYSESLRRKQPRTAPAEISALRVRNLMRPAAAFATENASLDEIMEHFVDAPYHHLLVVTLQKRLRGVIRLDDVENKLQRGQASDWINAAGLMQPVTSVVTPEMTLSDALEAFRHFKGERLAVVDNTEERRLLGVLSKTDVLLSLAHGLDDRAR